ncbi:MAG: ABC transporter substrate-binding protein [Gemmatimonadetes bacterium]|nr:ABC transporter substrate-binding protein [Gemmatimonadota bacterium]
MSRRIRVGHSPDSDDAFMFYALAAGKLDTGALEFVHELCDIETLNRRALAGDLEVTAVSIHAYAYLTDRYLLLPCGASMGEGYGPRIVATRPLRPETLAGRRVAVPGTLTSAFLALKLFQPDVATEVVPFDRVLEHVAQGRADAGLLIHEGQLTYASAGLHLVADLGEWWAEETGGLPLPLGGNVIRRDLGEELIARVAGQIRASIAYALEHRAEALAHAQAFGRGLDLAQTDEFVGMYVNPRTLDYGQDGRRAVQLFLDRGYEAGLIPRRAKVEFAPGGHGGAGES